MSDKPFYLLEDNLIEFDAVTDSVDDSLITDATGYAVVRNEEGDLLYGTVDGNGDFTAGATVTYKGSGGNYYAVFDKADLNPQPALNDVLYVEMQITSSGRDGFRRIKCRAQYHGAA